jgi:hypothetical protein
MGLFFELLLAAFAVFGVWCALRLAIEAWCSSPCITLTVCVSDEQTVACLGALICEARAHLACRRGSSIAVLYDRRLLDGERIPDAVLCVCRRHGARCYIADGVAEMNNETK